MRNIIFQIFLISILFPFWFLTAQPDWVYKTPPGYLNDFFVGRGTSKISKTEAVQFALEDAISSIIKNGQIKNQETENFTESKTEVFKDGESVSFDVISKIAKEIIIEGSSRTISNLKEVERYTEQNGLYSDAYVLVSIPKSVPLSPPNSFSPVWRSMLIPGWGQLYKEETFKGISFMTLFLGGVAGGFIFSALSEDATNKANSSRTQIVRDFYNNEAKNYNTYSTISFITAGVFYVWSLVDAIIVKQDNLYVFLDPDSEEVKILFRINL